MKIVVGVTASIAIYKALDLVNQLRKEQHEVRVVMTAHACEFVRPLAFETMSHQPVISEMFSAQIPALEHIELAKWADVCVIAPADANIIAKVANGLADDFLSTFLLAFDGPVLFAPAMNTVMFHQDVVQKNVQRLRELGYEIIPSDSGRLACGDVGEGKLAELETLMFYIKKAVTKQSLAGAKLIITAGPTIAKLDPVRYITNYSSGKMGFSLAYGAALRGAKVVLIAGRVKRQTPVGVSRIDVETTEEMRNAIVQVLPEADGLIMAAAPADYTPEHYSEEKIKKTGDKLTLILDKNVDILKSLKPVVQPHQVLIGFAAESHKLIANAQRKLSEKNLDFIVANNIAGENSAFQSDYDTAVLLFQDGHREELERQLKINLADKILDELERLRALRRDTH